MKNSFPQFTNNNIKTNNTKPALFMRWILALLMFVTVGANAQVVTVTGCTGAGNGTYTTLSAAATAIVAAQPGAAILVTVNGTTTEPAAGAVFVAGTWTSMLIQPTGGAGSAVIGAATAGNPLISFNGSDNVTIDGLNTGGNSLTISNTTVSATSGTATIRYQTDATSNTITNCTILGSSTSAQGTTGGNIVFASAAVTTGNDNNTVSNCNIGPAGSNLPTKLIFFSGSSNTDPGTANNGIVINNNNLFDYFGVATSSAAIDVNSGTTNISITNNKFYQTGTRTQTTATSHRAINLNNTSGNNYTVTGNTIGFGAANGTGTYSFVGISSSSLFIPINVNVGTTTASNINNNTIAGIAISGAISGTSSTAAFRGIYVPSGLAICNGNTIGSLSATNSITYTSSSSSTSDIIGIFNFGSSNWVTNNNNVGGITAANSSTGASNVYGIRCNTGSTVTWQCNNNIIGGTVANSLSSTSTSTGSTVEGILNNNPIGTFTGNTIRNLTAAAGTGTTSSASVIGLCTTSSANQAISQNTIHTLSNTSSSTATTVCGMQMTGSTANVVSKNFIHSLSVASATGIINGINIGGGTTTYSNNMIRLGIDAAGSNITAGASISGINEGSGTDNFYFNSVYIGGTSVASSQNTFAFNSTVTTNVRSFRNNIFYNARSNASGTAVNYAVQVGGTTANPTGLTINYNIYLANGTGGVFGRFNSLNVANLAAWKTAVGQDANSWESDPQYLTPNGTSATVDLHINPSVATAVEGKGINIAGITDDFDSQTRSALTPEDIGADAGNFTALPLCAGTPASSNITGVTSICSGLGTSLALDVNYTDIGITYQWKSGTTPGGPYPTTLGTSSTQATGNLTTTTYYICVITCTNSGLSFTTAEKAITVNALPSVAVTPTSAAICNPGGTAVTLNGSGATTYSWSPAAGLSATTGTPVSANPAATTTYTITGTDGNGCVNTATATISVGNTPSVSITPSAISICSGASTTLTASASASSGSLAAVMAAINANSAALIASVPTATSFALDNGVNATSITDGCSDMYDAPGNQLTTNLASAITYSDNVITSNSAALGAGGQYFTRFIGTSGCSAGPATIFYWAADVSGLTSFGITGFLGADGSGTQDLNTFTVTANGITYNCYLKRIFGAGDPSVNHIFLIPQPTTATQAFGATTDNDDHLLSNLTGVKRIYYMLYAGAAGAAISPASATSIAQTFANILPVTNASFSWSTGATTAATSVSPIVTTTYTVTATLNGCSNTATATVTAGDPLVGSAATFTSPNCAGTNFTVTAHSTGGGAPFNYAWSDGVGGVYPNAQTITANRPAGTYAFSCTITDGCGGSVTSAVSITVNGLPSISITPTPGNAKICGAGGSVSMVASGASTYAWTPTTFLTPSNGLSATEVSAATATTTYTVSGTDGNGCVGTATQTVLFGPAVSFSSVTATPASSCTGATSVLNAIASTNPSLNYTVGSIPVAAETPSGSPTVLSLNGTATPAPSGLSLDDGYWDGIALPFSFTYFGNTYSTVRIGTNGSVQFGAVVNTGRNPGASSYQSQTIPTGGAISSTNFLDNYIGGPLIDHDLSSTPFGKLSYYVNGIAPNRKFVISYEAVHVFLSSDNNTSQVILNENGTIDVLLLGGGLASTANKVIGIENIDGTVGIAAPGRNSGVWTTVADEAWRFTPPNSVNYTWVPATGLTPSANVQSPTTPALSTTTTYTVTATEPLSGCFATGTATVTINSIPNPPGASNSIQCGTAVPTAFVTGSGGTFKWYDAQTAGTLLQTGGATYTSSISATTHFWVSEANGPCESARTEVIASVNAPDVVQASVNNNNPCSNTSIQLTATTTGSTNGNVYNFVWTATPASGSGIPTSQAGGSGTFGSPAFTNVTPTASGTYTYTVTGTDATLGCVAISNVVVTVKALPVLNTPTASPAAICAGTSSTLTASTNIIAPGIATIGTGTTSTTASTTGSALGPNPLESYYGGAKQQMIILASELTSAGLSAGPISSISFNLNAVEARTLQNYQVKMQHTALSAFASTAFVSGGFTVVRNAANYTPVSGLNTLTFNTNFNWNGTSNLLIEVNFSNNDGGGTGTNTALYSTTAFTSSLFYRVDNTTAAAVDAATTATNSYSQRNNIQLGGQVPSSGPGSLNYTWNPGSLVGSSVSVSPSTTTTYTVTATDPATTCSSTQTVAVTVNQLPPSPSAINGTDQCGTGVSDMNVSSNNATDPQVPPFFKWYDAPTGGTLKQSGTSTTYTTAISTTTTLYVSEVSANGCEGPRSPITSVVSDPDPITVTTTSPVAGICIGSSFDLSTSYSPLFNSFATFDLTASGGATSGVTGTVSLTPNGTGDGTDPHTITPTAAGTYTYTVTAFDPDKNCTSVGTVIVIVNAFPTITTTTATPSTTCSGGTVSLSAFTAGVATITNYTQPFETFPVANFTTAGTGVTWSGTSTYHIQGAGAVQNTYVTNADGTLAMNTDISLVGTALPKLQFSHICASEQGFDFGKIEYSLNGGTNWLPFPATAYLGAGTLATEVDPNIGFDASSYPDWDAQFTDDLSTYPAAPATSMWKTETIDLSAYNNATTFRVRFRLTSDVSVNYAGWKIDDVKIISQQDISNTLTYTWNPGNQTGSTITVHPTSSTTYTVVATNAAGCASAAQTVSVTVTPVTASLTATPSAPVCAGTSVTLNGVAGGGAPFTYSWSDGTATVYPATASITVTPTTSTSYTLTVTDACSVSATATVLVEVNPLPTVTVTPTTASLCTPLGAAIPLNASGANTYSWSPVTGLSATTGSSVNATPTTSTTYTVTGTDVNGCIGTATAAITVNPNPTATASATPNPVCDGSTVSLSSTGNIPANYTVASIPVSIETPSGTPTVLATGGTTVVPFTAGNTATLDDVYWNNISLPFGFCLLWHNI